MKGLKSIFVVGLALLSASCATINIGTNYHAKIKEITLEKGNDAKVAMISLTGLISSTSSPELISTPPSVLDKFMIQLKAAEKDDDVVAILIRMNTPGGTVTASDIIYHELEAFKERTGKKVFVQMMDVAASGGYYIAMAADHIQAHPTTITGSIGVINILPDVSGLLDKVGVQVSVYKSGKHKDTNSPFRTPSQDDEKLVQSFIDDLAFKFHKLVQDNRNLSDQQMSGVKTARVYLGDDALKVGLVDSVGYISSAKDKACKLAEKKDCKLISYGYAKNPNATLYTPNALNSVKMPKLIETGVLSPALNLQPGSYFLYLP